MEWLKLRAGTASKELQARSFSPSPALRGIPAKGHTLFLFLVLSVRGTGLWSVYVRGGTMRMKRNTQNLSLLEKGLRGWMRVSPDGFGGQASDDSQCAPIVVR